MDIDHVGANLALDIKDAWEACQDTIPGVATLYSNATTTLDGIVISPEGQPEFLSEWLELRDDLQEIYRNSSINLENTADTLRQAVSDYVSTDGDNAAKVALAKAKDEYGAEPPDIPSPVAPETVHRTRPGLQP